MLHESIRDVETVILNAFVLKRDGRLFPVDIERCSRPCKTAGGVSQLSWHDIASALIKSRGKVDGRISELDMSAGAAGVRESFGIDKER